MPGPKLIQGLLLSLAPKFAPTASKHTDQVAHLFPYLTEYICREQQNVISSPVEKETILCAVVSALGCTSKAVPCPRAV